MVDVHQRVGRARWRSPALQHPRDHQGRSQRSAGRHPRPGQLRQRPHGKLGGQGGKSCGVYPPIISLSYNYLLLLSIYKYQPEKTL